MRRLSLALVGLALALTTLWCAVLGWEALHVIVLVGIIGALSFTAGNPLPRTRAAPKTHDRVSAGLAAISGARSGGIRVDQSSRL
jgi:hypothetical protein